MTPHKNFWPLGIFTAFGLFISGMATLIVIACSSPAHLVSKDYYEREVQYQEQIDRLTRANTLSAKPGASYNAATGTVTLSFPPGHAGTNTSGNVHLYRPSTANLDRYNELRIDENGRQTIDAKNLLPGLWRVKVLWTIAGVDYSTEQDLFVPGGKS